MKATLVVHIEGFGIFTKVLKCGPNTVVNDRGFVVGIIDVMFLVIEVFALVFLLIYLYCVFVFIIYGFAGEFILTLCRCRSWGCL